MFDNIIGNINNKIILKNTINNNKISHSYIFAGPEGVGKLLFAKEFAKAILCNNQKNKPCNLCKSCIAFENNNHPDYCMIDEQDETIKTETMKELTKDILEKPLNGGKKIYIINNSENMTREAQNTLLKTLEEPPTYVIIILITTNVNLLLNTIKSRCIKILFNKLTDDEMKQYFNNDITDNILKISQGSISNALKAKDKEEIYLEINKYIRNIENINELELLKLKNNIFSNKDDVNEILEYINLIFFDMIKEKTNNIVKYEKCIEIIEKTKERLKRNGNYDMTIDNCLMLLWEEVNG